MPPKRTIRTATAGDLEALNRAFRSSWGRSHADDLADQTAGDRSFFVAWVDGEPVGHAFVDWRGPRREVVRARYPTCPEIYRLAVDEPFRGRGIGATLVGACEHEARHRGIRLVGLGTDVAVPEDRNLYLSLGYEASEIARYDDAYRVQDPAGGSRTVRDPTRWLIKRLSEDHVRYAHYDPEPGRGPLDEAQIRRSSVDDAPGITRVWAERAGERPEDFYDEVRAAIARSTGFGWVAVAHREVVAYSQLKWREEAFGLSGYVLSGVTTLVAHRRRGLGRALTAVRMAWLGEQGAQEVFAAINSTNLASIELHRPFGFRRTDPSRRAAGPTRHQRSVPSGDLLVANSGTARGIHVSSVAPGLRRFESVAHPPRAGRPPTDWPADCKLAMQGGFHACRGVFRSRHLDLHLRRLRHRHP